MNRTHILAAAVLLPVATLSLTACFSGQAATTNMQATMNSGNGVELQVGDVHVEGTTLVLGPEGSGSVTMTARLINAGAEADTLTSVKIGDVEATLVPGPIEVAPGASISLGFDSEHYVNAYGVNLLPSVYVPVVVTFEKAGSQKASLLTVPAAGIYEGIAPSPATAASAAPAPAPSASAAASESAAPASPSPAAS